MNWMNTSILILFLRLCVIVTSSHELGSSCSKDRQCKVDNSHCIKGVCSCKHYHAQYNSTTCLESKLLGRECLLNEQCSLRVANSTCKEGHCHCAEGFISFRKHTCLKPAKIGSVCYSDEHCQLWTRNSYCRFLIPKLFGKCMCNGEGACKQNEVIKQPVGSTSLNENIKPTDTVTDSTTQITNQELQEEGNKNVWDKQNISKTDTPFADPFLHQKEHLQELVRQKTSIEKSPEEPWESEGIVRQTTEENDLKSIATADEILLAGPSKCRVEAVVGEAQSASLKQNKIKSVSLGYPCQSDIECQKNDVQSTCSNGICDCIAKDRGTNICNHDNTGCGPETFQCRSNGRCISWFYVCDGRDDCLDKSDEECSGPKCPKFSFQCESKGICLSLAVVCDGVKNCPNGEDESFCKPDQRNDTQGCPEHSFQCGSGECLPKFEFCNATPNCRDRSDEPLHLCTPHAFRKPLRERRGGNCPFECANKRCRSTAIVCSGRDGCGDNSDETHCSICRCPKIPVQ